MHPTFRPNRAARGRHHRRSMRFVLATLGMFVVSMMMPNEVTRPGARK
jgi:hypothetical protein